MIRKRWLHNPIWGPKVIDLFTHFGRTYVHVFVALEISETLSKPVTDNVSQHTRLQGHHTWKSSATFQDSMSSFNLCCAVHALWQVQRGTPKLSLHS